MPSSSLNKNNECGYLEIFIGPMFSGKTSKLIELYKQYSFCNIPLAVINHSSDNRYDDTMLSTHDKIMIPCLQTSTLFCVTNDMDNVDVILINEGQFFDDLYDFVVDMLKFNKKIYVSGLDGDFKRTKFGKILDLIPLCDKVTKMTSLCSLCKNGTPGLFSMRLTDEKEQMLIGSSNYIPVCRYCYEENENKK
uniref:thymidine kinase n=1 Tax=viral metagenome TaxID=1070528 RepID=A0A6C0BTW3_9ZZZZ